MDEAARDGSRGDAAHGSWNNATHGSEGDAALARLLDAICSLQTSEEVRALLSDLCTPREMADLSQRLEVARMLSQGSSYVDVSRVTGASSTTVSRVSKCLNGPAGGYRLVLSRLD